MQAKAGKWLANAGKCLRMSAYASECKQMADNCQQMVDICKARRQMLAHATTNASKWRAADQPVDTRADLRNLTHATASAFL